MSSSGNFNLTTYYAKRIIGDSAANTAASALLQTGTGVTTDTWIISRTNRATDYGILYNYDSSNGDTIEFVGGSPSATKAWVRLNDGAASFSGNTAIGGTLTVTGVTTITNTTQGGLGTGALVVNGGVSIAKLLYVNSAIHAYNTIALHFTKDDNNNNIVRGTKPSNTVWRGIEMVDTTGKRIGEIFSGYVTNTDSTDTIGTTRIDLYALKPESTDNYRGFSILSTATDPALMVLNDNTNLKVLSTTASSSASTGALIVNGGAGIGGAVNITGNTKIAGTLTLTKSTDASGTAANAVALIIGGTQNDAHIEIDANEIQAKGSGTTVANLSLNWDGGNVFLGVNDGDYYTSVRSTKDATSTSSGALMVSGGAAISKKLYANGIYSPDGSIWAGTFAANTAQSSEYDVGTRSGAGIIYLFSEATTTGDRGIYAKNAANSGAMVLKLNQNNRISALAPLTDSITFYNDNIVRGSAPAAWTSKQITFRSEDTSSEKKLLARIMNSYSTSKLNGLELVVYAPRADTTDSAYGLQMFAAVDSNTEYSYSILKGCLTIQPNQENYRQGLRIKAYNNWSGIMLQGTDLTNIYGTSANSWFLGNNNGNLYFTKNGASSGDLSNFSNVDGIWRLRGTYDAVTTGKNRSILHIYGPCYGNNTADIQSSTAGVMTFGDGGPQITFDTSATPGGAQAGALLFTDHDTAAAGASFHFLSNQTDWNVISKRFHARTSISIGTNLPTTGYALYVSGDTYHNGIIYVGNGSTYYINNSASARLYHADFYNTDAINIKVSGSPWPYIQFSSRAGGTDYVTVAQDSWARIHAQIPAQNTSNNTYYSTKFFFRQYSKTANSTTRLNYYEDFSLPLTNDDRTANGSYYILTDKNTVTTAQGGTGNTSYTASRLLYTNTATKFASGNIVTNGDYLGSVTYLTINSEHQTNYRLYVKGTAYHTDNITISKAAGGEPRFVSQATGYTGSNTLEVAMYVGSGKTNHGMYSNGYSSDGTAFTSNPKWMIYRNSSGTIIVNGNCTGYASGGVPQNNTTTGSWRKVLLTGGDAYAASDTAVTNRTDVLYQAVGVAVQPSTGTLVANNLTAAAGFLKVTNNGNTVTIGSNNSSWCHFSNSANIPFYFNKTIALSGDLGTTSYPVNNIYIGKSNGAGIYYQGTKASYRMIRFIDNATDANGNGISIGGGGLTVLGSGESADTLLTNLSLTSSGGTEQTYIASDNEITFYPGQQSYDASAAITMSPSRLWAGVNGNTTREARVGVQSGAGQLYLYSSATPAYSRGLYAPAHGTGTAKTVISVDTNNGITYYGKTVSINGTKRELQIRHGTFTVAHNTGYGEGANSECIFSPAFPTACIDVVAHSGHVGFGAHSTVSVGDITRTGFSLYQYNSQSANMVVNWVAFGY